MDKSKATIIAASTFVLTSGVMVMICANSHIDFFPCEKTERDFANANPLTGEAKLVTKSGTCSLMGHLRDDVGGEKDELTGAGWALLAAFCFGIAAADSALIYTLLNKKKPA